MKDALQFPAQPIPVPSMAEGRRQSHCGSATSRGDFSPRQRRWLRAGALLSEPRQQLLQFFAWGCRDLGHCQGTHGFHSTTMLTSLRCL